MTNHGPAKVLNVNDDAETRSAVSLHLRRAGFEVIEAATAAEALRLANDLPDVVVLAMSLPDENGFAVCKKLKENPDTARVAVLLTSSSFVSTPERVHGLEEGADGYLIEPIEAIELVATVRSLVRTKRAETQLGVLLERERVARERAEDASRAKDVFLAMISHELRTPLSAILGWTRLLRSGELDSERAAHALEAVERNANAQAQIVEDLLDVSRIVSGKLRIHREPMRLEDVVHRAADSVRPSLEAKQQTLALAIAPAAPMFFGDQARLEQVLWNLLSNAVKFTPAGGRIEVVLEVVGKGLRLLVHDTGKGIENGFLSRVFTRFEQENGGFDREHGGLGLGLAIARHIVEAHEGTIVATSAGEGHGATFVVDLPQTIEASTPSVRHPADAPANADDLAGVRVLVVDDEHDARELARIVLERAGCIVDEAASVEEALDVFATSPPLVLVSDIGMPKQDGYALVRAVRAMPSVAKTPAAAVTAYAGVEDRRAALEAGFQFHVAKPIEPGALVRVVRDLVRLAHTG